MTTLRYWIALNGSSCAMSSMPMRRPEVSPRPWQLIGFLTLEEAREAQRVCLNEPIPVVRQFMEGLLPAVEDGKIVVITHEDHDPQTGSTMWLDAPLPDHVH